MPGGSPTSKAAGAAVRTFPILLKWGLSTRPGIYSYPIGGSKMAKEAKRAAAFTNAEKQACVRDNATTLYHDLGVLAFDGCTYQQSRRIGDILAKTVALELQKPGAAVPEEGTLEAFEAAKDVQYLQAVTHEKTMRLQVATALPLRRDVTDGGEENSARTHVAPTLQGAVATVPFKADRHSDAAVEVSMVNALKESFTSASLIIRILEKGFIAMTTSSTLDDFLSRSDGQLTC
ncbi:hypothetical protein PWT90_08563 [Aphanocladium album]|nr:hypothetical protein PWT90_08563 [Aphanocladium album]